MNLSKENHTIVTQTSFGPIEYLAREDTISESSKTILCIHGAMGGYEQSDILGRSVGPAGYKYLSVSRPGYLKTPLHGRETPEAQADLFAALIEKIGIHKVIVLAISGGGYSAIHFALRHSDRCSALILCSTIGGKNDVPVPLAFNVMKLAARIPVLVNFMRTRFENNIEKSLKRSVSHQSIAEKMLNNEQLMGYYKELTYSTMDRMIERIPGTMNDIRITQNTEYPLENISVPTLIIHGTEDPVVPYNEHGKKLAERIPGAQLVLADKGEHMTIFTHNELVKKSISDFLSKC
jgi:pimeloyl-ACP methyl ester carboxylesterase